MTLSYIFPHRCNQKQVATRQVDLIQLPPVINIHLMRFVYDQKLQNRKKNSNPIQIPRILDLNK